MNCPFFITITALLTGTLTQNVPAGYFPLPGLPNLLRKPKKQKPAEDPMKSVELAKGVLTTFFSAGTVEEMAKHVRNPERALPRMKAYYDDTKPAPIKITFAGDWREVERGKSVLLLTTLQIDFEEVPLVVEVPEKDGPAKVDWKHSWAGALYRGRNL